MRQLNTSVPTQLRREERPGLRETTYPQPEPDEEMKGMTKAKDLSIQVQV